MDGIETIVPRDKVDLYYSICKEWEEKTNFTLEYDQYKKIYMQTVNDYIAITSSGKVKKKGDFITEFELWKNKSSRIIPMALEAYFIDGKDPIEFIENHKDIYDFCIMARATGQLHIEMHKYAKRNITRKNLEDDGWHEVIMNNKSEGWIKGNKELNNLIGIEEAKIIYALDNPTESIKLKKLVRYYLSENSEWQLFKRGIGTTGKSSNKILHAENSIGPIKIQYFNKFEDKSDYKIAYKHFILKTLERIDAIEGTKKARSYSDRFKPQIQTSLF